MPPLNSPISKKTNKRYWRVIELIKWGEKLFSSHQFESPRKEIEWLLCDLLSFSRVDLYLNLDHPIKQSQLRTLKSWINRRLQGEPLQYITGKTEFFGLQIEINPHVLIPRPETERLVEIALILAQETNAKKIVDIGTGSGCIAIALAANLKNTRIYALDNSKTALRLAYNNAKLNHVANKINFLQLDILTQNFEGSFDMLVSNPPYIPKDEVSTVMPEVRNYEPMNALTDGSDGLEFYRHFAEKGKSYVKKGGNFILEVGLNPHPHKVKKIFEEAGFPMIEFYKDLNGDDRIIRIKIDH